MSAAIHIQHDVHFAYEEYSSSSRLQSFVDGTLYKHDPSLYLSMLDNVCAHFEKYIKKINDILNEILVFSSDADTADDSVIDYLQDVFFELGDFAEHIVQDFKGFEQAVNEGVGKTELPRPRRIRFNNVQQLINGLPDNVAHIENEVMSYLFQRLSDEQMDTRAMTE